MEATASQLVKVYMQSHVLVGSIHYAANREARLLDALNGQLDIGPRKGGRFLELTDVCIQRGDGRGEERGFSYISKATVQLAVTLGGADSGRGIGAQNGPKQYPFVEKSPLSVLIETHDYMIRGKMYHMNRQIVRHVLEDAVTFLPLTHVQVCTLASGAREVFPFAAVNKDHILSLQEDGVKLAPTGLAVPGVSPNA
jgi:hypothetical protein